MALEPAKMSDFKLSGSLGTGATARVYDATHNATGRPVAIKMMEDSGSTPEMRERFAREALLLSGVESRYVSRIVGFGFEKGQPFLVLEKLVGETLDAKLRRDGPIPAKKALRWVEQLIIGIRDCHDAKVIHRDIKPSNVFLHHDGFDEMVKVIDFGVARLREITEDGSGALTSANHLIGSMGYMAPEQFTNAKGVQFSADLYAIGVVIFRILTGRLPFVSRSLQAVIKMKSEQSVPAISTMPGMPQNQLLDWFVQKSTARDPANRFQNAREMLDHWWSVQTSFDDEGHTSIMRKHRGTEPPSTVPHSSEPHSDEPSTPKMLDSIPVDSNPVDFSLDEKTIHKPPAGLPEVMPSSVPLPISSNTDRTIQRHFHLPSIDISVDIPIDIPVEPTTEVDDEAPHTVRERVAEAQVPEIPVLLEETRVYVEGADPFDLPTKSDPNLKKLVERELALQKARKERG
jgi:serine/threonine-protein kinase